MSHAPLGRLAAACALALCLGAPQVAQAQGALPYWRGRVAGNWQGTWRPLGQGRFGLKEQNAFPQQHYRGPFAWSLRVRYPKGSFSPNETRKRGGKVGGVQFYAPVAGRRDHVFLRYCVRFPPKFKFVKGGKLPGLYGGKPGVATGGKIPNGRDGWSTRFMWMRGGKAEVYAYLPTSKKWGTPIGAGTWRFRPGRWHLLEQEVKLNTPGKDDGVVRVWFDRVLLFTKTGLRFRTVGSLKVDGILFSTFFGGGDPSWATPQDTWIDFAGFGLGHSKLEQPDTLSGRGWRVGKPL